MSFRDYNLGKIVSGSVLAVMLILLLYHVVPYLFTLTLSNLGMDLLVGEVRIIVFLLLLSLGLAIPIRSQVENLVIRRELSTRDELLQFWVGPAAVGSIVGLLLSVLLSFLVLETITIGEVLLVYVMLVGSIMVAGGTVVLSLLLSQAFSSEEDLLETDSVEEEVVDAEEQ